MKGVVAAGHPLTAQAAVEILEKGGNAFDATFSVALMASFCEPIFASWGGGGFLLGHIAEKDEDFAYDFFVNQPGLGLKKPFPQLLAQNIHFTSTTQTFYVGKGSIAVWGTPSGLMQLYDERCTLEIEDLMGPVLGAMEQGAPWLDSHCYIYDILDPILKKTSYGREIFNRKRHARFYNPLYREFLQKKDPKAWLEQLYSREKNQGFLGAWQRQDAHMSVEDLQDYRVKKIKPLVQPYQNWQVIACPFSSIGGQLLMEGLKYMESHQVSSPKERFFLRAEALRHMAKWRKMAAGGTTHISVLDAKKMQPHCRCLRELLVESFFKNLVFYLTT